MTIFRNPVNIAYNFKLLSLDKNTNPTSTLFKTMDFAQPVSIYVEALSEGCEVEITMTGLIDSTSVTLNGIDATVLAGNHVREISATCINTPDNEPCRLEYGLSIGDPNTRVE
ncbi:MULTISPECIES: hypothetical protein [Bacillaceae]|uniref:hypothetical protein n=1 Tax=Bacillaceae TaxID=186817 RepID=UPI001BDE3B38|nr:MULTISPECIES: hypothetical protein [Bacillaceae]MDX8362711.1 hypothetical protein [Cytobacillus sp. IB215316]